MPYSVRKVPNRKCYKVFNKSNKRVFSKCTSIKKAKKQMRLLYAIQNNPKFRSVHSSRLKLRNNGGQTRKKYKKV